METVSQMVARIKTAGGVRTGAGARRITETVADYLHVPLNRVIGPDRHRSVVRARRIAMYLLRDRLGMSYVEIAGHFGRGDHTTSIHACRSVQASMELSDEYRQMITRIVGRLNEPTEVSKPAAMCGNPA